MKLTSDVDAVRYYDRVIWAAPKWATQTNTNLIEFLGLKRTLLPPGLPTVQSAMQELHVVNSSKAFVLTEDKFRLKNSGLPANIQSDTLIGGLYCLDYASTDPDAPGVVLISYT
ncbi:FAD-dependent oxidoreductase [Candidatus Poriferisodalis sp.]|uniref:FAD-dependent oxidoreductase n=1 Tax=Candidatus Poriferisodalis sp. TaxID=3101277 RepID=UPI003B0267ED